MPPNVNPAKLTHKGQTLEGGGHGTNNAVRRTDVADPVAILQHPLGD